MRRPKRLTTDKYIDQFMDAGGDLNFNAAVEIAEHEHRLAAKAYGKTIRALALIVSLSAQGQTVYTNSPELKRFLNKAYPSIDVEVIKDESCFVRPRFNL